jgi:hypothetical protein
MFMLLLACLVFLGPVQANLAVVNSLQNTRGSTEGGTLLTIWGSGFSIAGQRGSVHVYLGTSLCRTVAYFSSDTKIVCFTPPGSPGTVTVFVQTLYAGVSGSSYAACVGGPCTFTYTASSTPSLTHTSLGGSPGSLVSFHGNFLGGTTIDWFQVSLGGLLCDVSPEAQVPVGLPYSTSFPSSENLVGMAGRGVVKCFAPPLEAGRYNVSFEVRDPARGANGYGQATRARRTKQALQGGGAGGTLFHYTALPSITSLSSPHVGTLGGGALTIQGGGFSSHPGGNTVSLLAGDGQGGVVSLPCAVTASSPTSITCTPGAAPFPAVDTPATPTNLTGPFSQGAGFLHTLYPWAGNIPANTLDWATAPSPSQVPPPYTTFLNTDAWAGSFRNEGTYTYGQMLRGYFVPPVTANYSFYVVGDDSTRLLLSQDHTPARLAPYMSVAVVSSWVGGASSPYPTGPPVLLTAGTPYLLQLQHNQGWGEDHAYVGMRVWTAGNPAAAARFTGPTVSTFSSVPEVTSIALATVTVREAQVVVVGGAVVPPSSSSAAKGTWVLSVGGVVAGTSPTLTYGATASEVQNALSSVSAGGCASFYVTRTSWVGGGAPVHPMPAPSPPPPTPRALPTL